jgi:predicted glycoside hydrolase/deacetylase ChbG (UPF0249 family)
MSASPTLARLGFSARDRVLVIHADDVGMCDATVEAFRDLTAFGLVTCGSVMTPSRGFPGAAALARENPSLDVGVHLTLTSEWDAYRWPPLSTRDPASGLIDPDGYLPKETQTVSRRAIPECAFHEMMTQVNFAKAAGICPTHIDAHMYAAMEPQLFPQYLRVSEESGLPAFVSRDGPQNWPGRSTTVRAWEERGFPVFDHRLSFRWQGDPDDYLPRAKALIDSVEPGLTCLLIHPAYKSPELMSIVPPWRYYVRDYQAFLSAELRTHVRDSGIILLGYRHMKFPPLSSASYSRA